MPLGSASSALRLSRHLATQRLCEDDPGAVASARLVASGVLPEQANWNGTGGEVGPSRGNAREMHAKCMQIACKCP